MESPLKESKSRGNSAQAHTSHDNKDNSSAYDERFQAAGAKAFHQFRKELHTFSNAALQLGGSGAIIWSCFHLHARLANILFLYNNNAAQLFPRKVSPTLTSRSPGAEFPFERRRRLGVKNRRYKRPSHVLNVPVDTSENLDPENFPDQLEELSEDVATLFNCLTEFQEFTNEGVNIAIQDIKAFEIDLKYWSSCLKAYKGQFRTPSVQKYLHDLSTEMTEHIDNIITSLSVFKELGVPAIQFAQKHGETNLLNLSTVATFFSAVTATTMQFSFNNVGNITNDLVNCFWFVSLIFSIAAAVNSLLGLTWKQATYRPTSHRVPWWVLFWINGSPLVFLVLSVVCFSAGLCLFTYSSGQSSFTSTVSTILTAFTSSGLCVIAGWFALERLIFNRYRGEKWLIDVLLETRDTFLNTRSVELLCMGWCALRYQSYKMRKLFTVKCLYWLHCCGDHGYFDSDIEALPTFVDMGRRNEARSPITAEPRSSDALSALSPPMRPLENDSPDIPVSGAKQLWKNEVKTTEQMKQYLVSVVPRSPTVLGHSAAPFRRRSTLSSGNGIPEKRKPIELDVRLRIMAIQPKLIELESVQDIDAHQALVRHLQFSPDGQYLATSSWDRTSAIYLVKGRDEYGRLVTLHRILAHPSGLVGQVAWSPLGEYLLTKLPRAIELWTSSDGVCKTTIDCPAGVEAIGWFPDGKSFFMVEGNVVGRLDINGSVEAEYDFGSIKLFYIAVTPDGKWLLGVGTLMESPSGLQPKKSRIEIQTPVLNDVRAITLEHTVRQNEFNVLLSYENKEPSQLWKLDLVKDKRSSNMIARLILRHTYMPKTSIDFAGPSCFGGKNKELVLSAGKAGDIHIWDTESGAVVHHIRAKVHGNELTAFTWNHTAEDPFMFAIGNHDGGLNWHACSQPFASYFLLAHNSFEA
ncbi:hypothetical protein BDQ17DRAFT_1391948 [Cyathus striatus]|nr:hypothetical protein BDQ17DRAFT_1391948 [Cyathus striatus]